MAAKGAAKGSTRRPGPKVARPHGTDGLTDVIGIRLTRRQMERSRAIAGNRAWRDVWLDLLDLHDGQRNSVYRQGVQDGLATARAEAATREVEVRTEAYQDGVLAALVVAKSLGRQPLYASGPWAQALAERLQRDGFVRACGYLAVAFGARYAWAVDTLAGLRRDAEALNG